MADKYAVLREHASLPITNIVMVPKADLTELLAERDALAAELADYATSMNRLLIDHKYMVGIAERGQGASCPESMSGADYLLSYVKGLEVELAELRRCVPAWTPVHDRIPPEDYCLLRFASGVIAQGRKRYGLLGEPSQDQYEYRASCCGKFHNVTHWMPLPAAPSGQEEGDA